jgi:hypothetical protein
MTSNEVTNRELGDPAPDFVLSSTNGKVVRLFSIADGPIVLFFFTDTFNFFSLEFSSILKPSLKH